MDNASAGPFSRFIVKYRDGTAVADDRRRLPERLQATAASAGLPVSGDLPDQGLALQPVRRLAVGAEVFTTSRALGRDEAAVLIQAFAVDPDVEYIEIDALMTTQRNA